MSSVKEEQGDLGVMKNTAGVAGVKHIAVLDYVRALAIIQVFLYHYYAEWFGGGFLIVPDGVQANFERLWIFSADGGGFGEMMLALFRNMFSWLFVYGFAAVNIFLVVSGFVLAFGVLSKGGFGSVSGVRGWFGFYWKRWKRVLIPFYISLVVGILFWWGRDILFPAFADWPLFGWWDLLKVAIVPYVFFDIELLQRFNGDYWFITLILQLYIIFPLLFYLMKRWGVARFLLLMLLLTFGYRFYAVMNLPSVPMGVIFPSEESYRLYSFFLPRLAEFSFGMVLAYLYFKNDQLGLLMKKFWVFIVGMILVIGGYVALMYPMGWIFSDAVLSLGLFFVFIWVAERLSRISLLKWIMAKIGESAYETYLLHHYFLNYFLTYLLLVLGLRGNETVFWAVMPIYFILSVLLGVGGRYLTVVTEGYLAGLSRWWKSRMVGESRVLHWKE